MLRCNLYGNWTVTGWIVTRVQNKYQDEPFGRWISICSDLKWHGYVWTLMVILPSVMQLLLPVPTMGLMICKFYCCVHLEALTLHGATVNHWSSLKLIITTRPCIQNYYVCQLVVNYNNVYILIWRVMTVHFDCEQPS